MLTSGSVLRLQFLWFLLFAAFPREAVSVVSVKIGDHCGDVTEENLHAPRHNFTHLSLPAIRDFQEQAYRDRRFVYNCLPSPARADSSPGVDAVMEGALIRLA
jgi:hypothetical protein